MKYWACLLVLGLAGSVMAEGKPLEIIAHRGESADAPENTLAAFKLAWERKVTTVELDVHLTKDGVAIVIHDFDTKRVAADGVKKVIKETNFADLRQLDVGTWKDKKFAGEKLPTLDESLATIPSSGKIFIEIKVGPESIPAVKKAIETCGKKPEQLVIISFNADTVAAAKKAMPHIKAYYLSSFKQDKKSEKWAPSAEALIKKAKEIKADGLNVAATTGVKIDREFVEKVKKAGLGIYVWTVDSAELGKELQEAGVEGITTNRAAWLRDQLKSETKTGN